ncbi:hypothetical protein RM780_24055, partial [Streptomyces sp. DSM 44917]
TALLLLRGRPRHTPRPHPARPLLARLARRAAAAACAAAAGWALAPAGPAPLPGLALGGTAVLAVFAALAAASGALHPPQATHAPVTDQPKVPPP